MKPVMFCRKTSGILRWQHSSMKCAPFSAAREQDAVVGDDAHRHAVQVREAAHQRGAVAGLELVELAAIDDAGDDLAHVEGLARIGGDHAIQFLRRIQRFHALAQGQLLRLAAVEVADDVARDGQGMGVVLGQVIGHARQARVDVAAAQFFGRHHSPVAAFTSGGPPGRWCPVP
jgi:hypothetical protein